MQRGSREGEGSMVERCSVVDRNRETNKSGFMAKMIWLTLLVFNNLTYRLVYMYISTGIALINKSLALQRGNDVDTLRMAELPCWE